MITSNKRVLHKFQNILAVHMQHTERETRI